MSKRIPTHVDARGCLSRFNSSHWKNSTERARYSIPADPNRDDDILLGNYIDNAEQVAARLETALGLLNRARDHIADLQPLQGACEHPNCAHRYCADLKATNAESVAIVADIDRLATVDADTAREAATSEPPQPAPVPDEPPSR